MYVARFTMTPEYDPRRNWSAWMGMDYASQEEAYEAMAEQEYDYDTIEEKWESWQDESKNTWHYRDHESRIDFLRDLVSADIRFNEEWCRWQVVHHNGLSCWPLQAGSVAEAIAEATESNLSWYGFGSSTVGDVKHVAAVDGVEYLHIFECNDITGENS